MIGALKVELVGGGGPWTFLAPAVVALIVGFGTAWLTIRTANKRHEKQLAYDREMRDREAARAAVDQTFEAAHLALPSLQRAHSAVAHAEVQRKFHERSVEGNDPEEEQSDALEAAFEAEKEASAAVEDTNDVVEGLVTIRFGFASSFGATAPSSDTTTKWRRRQRVGRIDLPSDCRLTGPTRRSETLTTCA